MADVAVAAPTVTVLETKAVPLASLRPYPANPRNGDVDLIRESVRAHGQYRAMVVNRRTMEVLAGNHLLHAMLAEGFTEGLAHFVDVDDEEAARIVLIDNRASDLARYDDGLLAQLLESLPDLDGTGYDAQALAELLRGNTRPELSDPDEGTEPAAEPASKPGDLWLLGGHRLLCGDASDPEARAKLLEGVTPRLVVTDPPYGVSVDHMWRVKAGINRPGVGTHHHVANDTRSDWSQEIAAIGAPVVYQWAASLHLGSVMPLLEATGYEIRALIIWAKQSAVISQGHYHWRHESCLYAVRKGATASWRGSRDQTTVWEAASPRMGSAIRGVSAQDEGESAPEGGHASQKPVAIFERPMNNHLKAKEWVVDPFAGSGTAIIAAERAGVRCAAMEMEPQWVDAICKRWESYTGQKPRREDGTEVSFLEEADT